MHLCLWLTHQNLHHLLHLDDVMMFGSAKKLSLREHEQALSQAQYQLASLEALRKGSAATLHDLQAQLQGTRVNPLLFLSLPPRSSATMVVVGFYAPRWGQFMHSCYDADDDAH